MFNELPKRKSIRLQGYDYLRAGQYFITICIQGGHEILGEIVGADDPVRPQIKLTDVGNLVDDCWNKINDIYENVSIGKYCIMPNHFHGIVIINDNDNILIKQSNNITGGQGRPPLQKVLQGFKSVTTRMCFDYGLRKLWQRSFYDRIIRNQEEYKNIWKYIKENPQNWEEIYN